MINHTGTEPADGAYATAAAGGTAHLLVVLPLPASLKPDCLSRPLVFGAIR